MSDILKTANYWVSAGVAIIPIRHRDKRPEAQLLPDGKWEAYQTRLPSNTELRAWFTGGFHNIALIVGWQNITVLDFDELGGYLQWRTWATRAGGLTERVASLTYMVKTARGVHVYIRTAEQEVNRKLPGLDIKAQRGYVLIPPSIHPSGAAYEVLQPGVPIAVEALSAILPTGMLVTQQMLDASPAQAPPQILSIGGDVWSKLDHAPDPTRELVDQVRETYRVEQFFPDAEASSVNHRWLMSCCPFHDDKRPSFWIDTARQICGCFGGCTAKPLDVINLYARLYGLTNRDAILVMAKSL